MRVNWKYDILFSFQVNYSQKLKPDDFIIIPTNSCRKLLKKHNLIFKSSDNGAMVISEKRIISKDSMVPMWRINKLTDFTFILKLRNQSLFSRLSPYNSESDHVLPDIFGKRRLLYFDNLDENLKADQNLTPVNDSGSNNLDLSYLDIAAADNGLASNEDLASLVPNKFTYRKGADVTKVVLKPLKPEPNDELEFRLTNRIPQVDLVLAAGAYQFEQVGSVKQLEIIFAGSELYNSDTFGVIQIYKSENTDYNSPIRYNINFKKS